MPDPNQAALDFLLNRRSHPAKTLNTPVPDRAELLVLLTAAARVPDHGKLEPWRFVVLERPALARLATEARTHAAAHDFAPEQAEKGAGQFENSHLAIAVIEVQRPSEKAPAIEQCYSTGAVCLSLVNAALAAGWGASWLTGWPSHDRVFARSAFELAENERVAGLIHIGTRGATPPERPRPDIEGITTWTSA